MLILVLSDVDQQLFKAVSKTFDFGFIFSQLIVLICIYASSPGLYSVNVIQDLMFNCLNIFYVICLILMWGCYVCLDGIPTLSRLNKIVGYTVMIGWIVILRVSFGFGPSDASGLYGDNICILLFADCIHRRVILKSLIQNLIVFFYVIWWVLLYILTHFY